MRNYPVISYLNIRQSRLSLASAIGWFALSSLFIAFLASIEMKAASEGSDLEFGGPGTEPGQFSELRDLTFDDQGNLYTLEGLTLRHNDKTKAYQGNGRVQKFDRAGKPLLQFPVGDRSKTDGSLEFNLLPQDSQRLAVDKVGNIYVTQPGGDRVLIFSPDGKLKQQVTLNAAFAITRWHPGKEDLIAVMPCQRRVIEGKGWTDIGGDSIVTVAADGTLGKPLALERTLAGVSDMAAGPGGDLYVIAATNQLYRFAADGKLLATVGAGEQTRANDGSELIHTVGVDSKGFVYSFVWGNPSMMLRFSPDFSEVRRRDAQFKWADPWGPHSNYTPLAVDPQDRVWVCATQVQDPNGPNFKHYNPVPAVIRSEAGFFDDGKHGVMVSSAFGLGFKPRIEIALPAGIAYDLAAAPLSVVVAKANRRISDVKVNWRVLDMYRKELAHGELSMPLSDGVEASAPIAFTPPALGWYMVVCDFSSSKGVGLGSICRFFGVTKRYPGMIELSDANPGGGVTDPFRTAFSGLMNQRLHAVNNKERLETLDKEIAACEKAGVTWFVQLSDKKDCEPDNVRTFVERYKGRVKVWEIMNEPNFSFSPPDYVKVLKEASRIIREADPAAKIMAPDVCGIDLGWYETLYKEGAAKDFDILSIHDYEGHETIDPVHWRWKIGALRALMERYGDGKKPIWQTERAITAERGDNFLGATQAIRTTLHRDLLETLGISPEHNNHFYTNNHGFGGCPSWIWSESGPHPAALALRVRHAMTEGRAYQGTLDFGPVGERLLLGLRYVGSDGSTIIVRNLGSLDLPLEFTVTGTAVEVIDSFGNSASVPVKDGKVTVVAKQMPTYLRLAKGQELQAPRLDFGRNLSPSANITCSAADAPGTSLLKNGILETINAGNPNGGTDGKAVWSVDMSNGSATVELAFATRLPLSAVVISGLHADNSFCSLIDYDLEWSDGGKWKTVEAVRIPTPPSEPCVSAGSIANLWSLDYNVYLHRFAPVTTDRLRLVAKRVTQGFVPDDKARAWGNLIPQRLYLREIEVYGPTSTVRAEVTANPAVMKDSLGKISVTVSASNTGTSAVTAAAKILPPAGWTAIPAEIALQLPAGGKSTATTELTPSETVPSGKTAVEAVLSSAGKHLDIAWTELDITAPVTASPQPPPEIIPAAQPFVLELKNPGDKPVSGNVHLVLEGPRTIAPVDQAFGPIAPGQTARVELKVPNLELLRQAWKATWTVTAEGRSVTVVQNMALKAWNVFGPFPNQFDTDFGPEAKLDLKAVSKDQMGNERRWRMATQDSNGYLDLARQFDQHDNVCAYAVAWVRSPEARKVQLSLGSDDGDKVWLNGKLVHSDNGAHGASPGQFKVAVELRAGWNEVLFKVTQGGGGWGMYCDMVKPDGSPMGDLVWSETKQ